VKHELEQIIRQQVSAFEDAGAATRWRPALVGIAAASDPMFRQLRAVVGPTHALPDDLLPGARSVVAFFLPFAREVGRGNYAGRLASDGWATAYLETNQLIGEICEAVRRHLEALGHRAHATPATHNFDPVNLVSDWSHRHVAVIAGLGTLGLHNLLITARGSCGRLGSLITTAALEPDARPVEEACLSKRGGACQRCIHRCVGQALEADRFDRRRCKEILEENERARPGPRRADVCGKCLVKVPCSHEVPPMKAPPAR